MASEQITTLSIFKYTSFSAKVWAFGMMQFAHSSLSKAKGCTFYKLLGSGKENFNPFPDWSVYAVLQVWNSEEEAKDFIHKSSLFQQYKTKSTKHHILYLQSIQARGEWNGGNPFQKTKEIREDAMVCAITRASIKLSKLRTFWKFVPYSQQPLLNAKGLLYTKGFGEVPFVEMATFSVWENAEQLNQFAYQSLEHIEAIQKTRTIKWYKEELFSRFQLASHEGNLLPL
jgi:spheroidene monooxygenase